MESKRSIPLVVPPDCEILHLPPGEYVIVDPPLYVGDTKIVGSGARNTILRTARLTQQSNFNALPGLDVPHDREPADAA